jgi:hypothetical protein
MTAVELLTLLTAGPKQAPLSVLRTADRLVEANAPVDVVAMPAVALSKMIDQTYADSTGGLARVADDVRALADMPVRLCRAEVDEDVLLAVLAMWEPTVISVFVHDRSAQRVTLGRAPLERLLRHSTSANRTVALESLRRSQEAAFPLHRQDAIRTARTFLQKYSAAMQSGVEVNGLDAFVSALRRQNGKAVFLMNLPAPDSDIVLGVREDQMEILEVLHVLAPGPDPASFGEAARR